ncbi:MAG: hypothetical protein RBS82_13500 [Syntrophales bacterium]|jgi:hypothetical protein|nr:hypothetical protein [Syntrophales bacterium]
MRTQDLILGNPFYTGGSDVNEIVPEGGFGAVLSRAGVGKTAFVVQLALNSMLRGKNVLHISLGDSIEKVSLWYHEQFQRLSGECSIEERPKLWEEILPHRFIMTFKISKFNVPVLEERLTDLTAQNIFHPSIIIIDGFSFDNPEKQEFSELKALACKYKLQLWFTVHTHPDETIENSSGRLLQVLELFDVALELKPHGAEVHITALKNPGLRAIDTKLRLDPSTMLIKNFE